jgi:8-oxo-dGTP pyrophosphatase MutT (NUDIX family)
VCAPEGDALPPDLRGLGLSPRRERDDRPPPDARLRLTLRAHQRDLNMTTSDLPTEPNPWRTVSSRLTYANAWMRVREDLVRRPDGSPGIYGVMEPVRVATGVVALTDDRHVWLVGQFRYPTNIYSWEIIEGGADPHEDPLAGAQRELREEAGLLASAWSPLGGQVHLSNCLTSERCHIYLARGLRHVGAQPEATEVLRLARVPLHRALELVDSGAIHDAVSVIGLLAAERFLRRGS